MCFSALISRSASPKEWQNPVLQRPQEMTTGPAAGLRAFVDELSAVSNLSELLMIAFYDHGS